MREQQQAAALQPAGFGLAWRSETAQVIARLASRGVLTFTEIIAENFPDDRALPRALYQLVDSGVPVIVHGVSLSLGSSDTPDPRRMDRLAHLAERLHAPMVSEHVALVRAGELEAGHLLPVPRTQEMLAVLIENVRIAQRGLPVPLVLEHVASLVEWPAPVMDEADFLEELTRATGARLLLDVSNLHANSKNHGWNATRFIKRLPLERVAYVHVAGGIDTGELYHDTHAHPVGSPALALLEQVSAHARHLPVLLERDAGFTTVEALELELRIIHETVTRARAKHMTRPDADVHFRADPHSGSSAASRARLGAEQRAFIEALLAQGPIPPGFVAQRVDATAKALSHKRQRDSRAFH